jgi:hypothetical protein
METEMARQHAIRSQGPIEIFGSQNPIPPETVAILNTMPPNSYNSSCRGDPGYVRGERCKSVKYKSPLKTQYDQEAPFVTYRKFRSNRYRKNRGHMIVSGDRYVHCNLTRSYIFHRPPFDWYDARKADILDDIEEVVPVAGTLGDVHTKDIYATPNFIGNHHMMNLHQNRFDLTDESDSDDDYGDYADYEHNHHRNKRPFPNRPSSRIRSRPINPEDDISETNSKPRSLRHYKTESRNVKSLPPLKETKPRFIKNGNRSARRFSHEDEEYSDYDENNSVIVHSYSTPKMNNENSEKFDQNLGHKTVNKSVSVQNVNSNNLETQFEMSKVEGKSSLNTKVEVRNNEKSFQKAPHVLIKNPKRNEPTLSELTHYNHAINNYVQSTAKMINKDQVIPARQHDSYVSTTNKEIHQKTTTKKRSEDEITSQIIKDLMNVHMTDKSNSDKQLDVKYY